MGSYPFDVYFGYKYLLIYVDANSKYTWVFPLKLKYDVLVTITHFITAVEVQFSTKIKALQIDGEGDFKSLTYLFNTKGISHRLACPHTHRQNGYVERKHRHVVETGLTLLAQANLPLKLCNHAWVCLLPIPRTILFTQIQFSLTKVSIPWVFLES